ncbi:MAG: outer membrane protein [Rhodomicrobium sp.]
MLRRVILGAVSAIALTASANAADMYTPGPAGGYKDAYVPVDTWAGFYVGVNGGYAWGNDSTVSLSTTIPPSVSSASFAPDGGFGGGQIGYNWQGLLHPNLVLGIEADIQGADISGKATVDPVSAPIATAESRLDWFGTVRGRLGYSFGSALLYATGGFAYGGVEDKLSVTSSGHTTITSDNYTATGWVVGGGVEYKLAPAWSVKAEYQYIDIDDRVNHVTASATFDHAYNTVRLGVNYHFLPAYEPLK